MVENLLRKCDGYKVEVIFEEEEDVFRSVARFLEESLNDDSMTCFIVINTPSRLFDQSWLRLWEDSFNCTFSCKTQ